MKVYTESMIRMQCKIDCFLDSISRINVAGKEQIMHLWADEKYKTYEFQSFSSNGRRKLS